MSGVRGEYNEYWRRTRLPDAPRACCHTGHKAHGAQGSVIAIYNVCNGVCRNVWHLQQMTQQAVIVTCACCHAEVCRMGQLMNTVVALIGIVACLLMNVQ